MIHYKIKEKINIFSEFNFYIRKTYSMIMFIIYDK